MYPTKIALAAAIAVTVQSGAISANSISLEEVIVTAQKREQSLQDVPLSVQVVDGQFLEDRNINQVSELSKVSPGFTFAEGSSDSSKGVILRGIGSQSFSKGMDQSVGVVIDGVVASSAASSLLDMSDVERIEVLRGPQGMLFGKNASAGLLNIVTKRPSEELTYGMGMTYAEHGQQKVNAYVSGPLIEDKVLGRLSYYSSEQDGLVENIYDGGDDHNNRDEFGFKGKLEIFATDELSILLSANKSTRSQICCATPIISKNANGDLLTHPNTPTGTENTQISDNDTSTGRTELEGYSAEFNYDIGDHVLTAITSWSKSDERSNYVSDQFAEFNPTFPLAAFTDATGVYSNASNSTFKQITQEIRLTSPDDGDLTYVVGLYLYDKALNSETDRLVNGVLASLSTAPNPFAPNQFDNTVSEVDNRSYALFGQATYHLTDFSRLSFGLRYNREEIDVLINSADAPAGTVSQFPDAVGIAQASDRDEAISWRLVYEYDLFEQGMVYGSVARGYKGPGVNTLPGAVGVAQDNPIIVQPEVPTNFELGLKSQFWDNRLRLNANLFYTSFKNFQAQVSDGGIPPTFILQNAGELETQGLEVDFALAMTENFTLTGGLAYVDASYAEFKGAACYPGQTVAEGCVDDVQDLSGADMPNSPEWSYTLSGRYDIPMSSVPFDGYVQGTYYWQDDVQYNSANDPQTIGTDYAVADLAFGIESHEGTYSVQLFVKNLFNDFYVTSLENTYRDAGVELAHSLPYDYERRVGLSAQVNF